MSQNHIGSLAGFSPSVAILVAAMALTGAAQDVKDPTLPPPALLKHIESMGNTPSSEVGTERPKKTAEPEVSIDALVFSSQTSGSALLRVDGRSVILKLNEDELQPQIISVKQYRLQLEAFSTLGIVLHNLDSGNRLHVQ